MPKKSKLNLRKKLNTKSSSTATKFTTRWFQTLKIFTALIRNEPKSGKYKSVRALEEIPQAGGKMQFRQRKRVKE